MKQINSLTNSHIKQIVELHETKGRKEYGLCLVEGIRAVTTFIQAGQKLQELLVTEQLITQAEALCSVDRIALVNNQVMRKISSQVTPSGIVGIFKIPQICPLSQLGPGIVLAQLQDPGNMGALIRTAVAVNVSSVVIIEGTDPWSPKVIQASAGTIAQASLFQTTWSELIAHKKDITLSALVTHSGTDIRKLSLNNNLLAVGSEAHGLPASWQAQCDNLVTLPMPGKAESLNAAIAGSIALYLAFVK